MRGNLAFSLKEQVLFIYGDYGSFLQVEVKQGTVMKNAWKTSCRWNFGSNTNKIQFYLSVF